MSKTGFKLLVLGVAFLLPLTNTAPHLKAQEVSRESTDHKASGHQPRLTGDHAEYESETDGIRGRTMLRSCGELVVGVDYGRPRLGGRDLDGVREGFIWRLGKGRPTILKTTRRITFPGIELDPGIYSLFLKHEGKGQWSLVIHRGESGGNPSRRNPDNDVAAIRLASAASKESQEILSIALEPIDNFSALLNIAWGTFSVSTALRVEEGAIGRCW